MIPSEIADSLQDWFEKNREPAFKIHSCSPLGGGSINQVYKINTGSGIFCLKFNQASRFPQMFETEARGLSLLRNAKEIRIPRVITVQTLERYSYILLEYIEAAPKQSCFMQNLGRSLAKLHGNRADLFGLDHDNYMGALPQSNAEHQTWISFFIEERIEIQVKLARDAGLLSSENQQSFQRLYKRLETFFPYEKPSLVHGDLWNGNVIVSETGNACLIDPAVYFGHREIDIAMTTLFGGFGGDFYKSYQEAFPMEQNWEERLEVYNLYPLLIHLNLFGTGYLGSILSVLKKF